MVAGGGHAGGHAGGVIYQCASCRSLVSARHVVADTVNERAALACDVCGARTWLPFASAAQQQGARVVDVEVDARPTEAAARALPTPTMPTTTSASTALVPAGAIVWSDEQRARIATRLERASPHGDAQGELAAGFTKLLAEQWSNETEHKNFLKKASLAGELAFAGQRYRAVLEESPGDERAKKAQNDILALAMASMNREKDFGSTGGAGSGTSKKLLAAAVLIAGVLACIAILRYLPRMLDPEGHGEGHGEGYGAPPAAAGDQTPGGGQNIAPPEPGR
jgi:hypothetical protein